MKIKKIRLEGYKRFHDLTIDLGDKPKRIVALVGPNGCGKSSVLDGMLFHNNAYNMIGNKDSKDYKYHSIAQTPDYDYRKISIETDEGKFYEVRNKRSELGKTNTIFSFRSPYRYNSNLKVTETRSVEDIRLNRYGATTSSDIDDKMEENYRRLYIKYNNYLHQEDCRPSEAKKKIIGDLNNSIKNCLDLEIEGIGNIESNEGTLFFQKTDQPEKFEFNVLSAGEKEVVDIILDLYLRSDEYDDTVFLIDEPELHINTSIQRKLLLEINKLVGENCQIWIATHSIGFLRALQDELKDDCQIIYFQDGIEWASTTQTILPMKKTLSNWKKIFETALDDLVGLLSPKRIVYCEGKDRPGSGGTEKGFDAKVLNEIFGEEYPDTLFISSGGNTELDQRSEIALAVLSKALTNLEVLVFKDRDVSSGKINSEEDRQLYLDNNPESFRIMKRWEIENYLYDKAVLSKYCEENNLTFKENEYDDFVTDIVNQNLKDHTGRIRNFCSITTSINSEILKMNLSKCISKDMEVYKELEECVFNRK